MTGLAKMQFGKLTLQFHNPFQGPGREERKAFIEATAHNEAPAEMGLQESSEDAELSGEVEDELRNDLHLSQVMIEDPEEYETLVADSHLESTGEDNAESEFSEA